MLPSPAVMRILTARFQNRSDFLAAYSHDLPTGGLFVPTTAPIDPATSVVVELICNGLPNKVLIRSTVLSWRPALPRLRVRAGAQVAFDAGEAEKRDFVLAALGGQVKEPRRRKHTRLPVEIAVSYRLHGSAEACDATLTEISIGGALLRSATPLPIGTDLVLSVVPPGGAAAMEIDSKVSYVLPTSVGIKFLLRDSGGQRRLRELCRRLRVSL